jgi:hypothetical protein
LYPDFFSSCRYKTFVGTLNISYLHFGFIYIVHLIDFVWITLRCIYFTYCQFFVFGATAPQWGRGSSFTRFLNRTHRRTTVRRTPLDERSARRRDLYLTTLNNRQTSVPPVGFEPTISAGERPQAYALDRPTTGIGIIRNLGD